MRFLTNLLSAIAGVFRRGDETEPPPLDASSSATMELCADDIELIE
jgi:hypothetical protein